MKPDDKIAFIEPLLNNVWCVYDLIFNNSFFFSNCICNTSSVSFLQIQSAATPWLVPVSYIAVLMGLGHSFCLHPCSHRWFLLSVYHWITLEQAPWFYSFHALHSTGYKSLFQSSAIPPRVHISLCSVCAAPFATPALSVSACQSLICTSSICPPTLQFLLISFMFTLFHLPSFKISSPSSSLFRSKSLDMVYCCSVQFTANIFLTVEVYSNTTFKYNIKAVVQKPYKT